MSEPHPPDNPDSEAWINYSATRPRWGHLRKVTSAAAALATKAPDGVLECGIHYWVLHRSSSLATPQIDTTSAVNLSVIVILTADARVATYRIAERLDGLAGGVRDLIMVQGRPLNEADLELFDTTTRSVGPDEGPGVSGLPRPIALRAGVHHKGDGLMRALTDLATEHTGHDLDHRELRPAGKASPGRARVLSVMSAPKGWLVGDVLQRQLAYVGTTVMVLATPVFDLRPAIWALMAMAPVLAYVLYVEMWASDRIGPVPVPALTGALSALGTAVTYLTSMWFNEWPVSPMRLLQFFDWPGASGFAGLMVVFAICAWLVSVSLVVAFRGATCSLRESLTFRQTVVLLAPPIVIHSVASAVGLAACAGLVYR